MKYAYYISGHSGRLTKYLRGCSANEKSIIKVVVSDEKITDGMREILNDNSIEMIEWDRKKLMGTNQDRNLNFSNMLCDVLIKYNVDYCFSFGSHILCGRLLTEYRNRIINFHPSVLPMYKGMKAIDQAVSHGNTFLLGNTAHFIDEGVDTGKIIMQSVIPTKVFTESGDYDSVLDLQIDMLKQLIYVIENDMLIVNDESVEIKDAEYTVSNIYPHISISN